MTCDKVIKFEWDLIAHIQVCNGFGFVWNKNTLKEKEI